MYTVQYVAVQGKVGYIVLCLLKYTCVNYMILTADVRTMPFLELSSGAVALPSTDDDSSNSISITGGFPFGRVVHDTVYVSQYMIYLYICSYIVKCIGLYA